MNKIIKYINETEISAVVDSIVKNNKDIWSVIEQIKESRIEYQKKSQELQNELVKLLPDYKVGMILEAKEDCLNNWRKGDRVEITLVKGNDCVLDGAAAIDEKWIRKYFMIIGSK
jgi:hypothetical protein